MGVLQDQMVCADSGEWGAERPAEIKAARALSSGKRENFFLTSSQGASFFFNFNPHGIVSFRQINYSEGLKKSN